MATVAINLYSDLQQPVKVQYIDGNMFSMDNAGNTVNVYVNDGGEPATLSGDVSALVIRPDGATVAVPGALDGNRAYVIMPQAVYAVPGVVSVVVKLTINTTVTTIAAFVANVYQSSTDTVVDPGTIIPSVQNLISAINAAVASIPADYSALWATLAPAYSSKTYAVGDYCTNGGVLYRCIVPITAAESWTAAHWTAANIGNDLSALKSAITDMHTLGYTITSDLLEAGLINNSGEPASATNRCRTKEFIAVEKGDTVVVKRDTSSNNGAMVFFYDTSKTFISKTAWLDFKISWTYPVAEEDGYIKLLFDNIDTSLFDKAVKVSKTSKNITDLLSLENKLHNTVFPIPSEALDCGYWVNSNGALVRQNSATRYATLKPVKLKKGDEIYFTRKSDLQIGVGYKRDSETVGTFTPAFNNMPVKMPYDANAYITLQGGSSKADYDGLVAVKHAEEIEVVEYVRSSDLFNGYINDNGNIGAHAERLVNWKPIHANKGDRIRLHDLSLMIYPKEFDQSKNLLFAPNNYYTPVWVGGNYQLCGDYIVQNDDCWVMCTVASIGATPSGFTPANYDKVFSVIHVQTSRDENTAYDTMVRFPKAPRKGKPFNTEAIASQGMTVVNGDLWSAVDSSTDYINVIDINTGEIKRTITHDIGHCNSLDYCEETDCIITTTANGTIVNPKIIIIPNVSQIQNSINLSNCLQISVDSAQIDLVATICFGQDKQEAWIYTGYGSANPYDLYKIVLEYTNGAYTGNILSYEKYTGIIRDNVDTHVCPGTAGYAQDCCYDGYLYLGYGTAGHNFLVLDIDEYEHTYRVVGNYLHKEYDATHVEFGVEPEGIALYDGKVFCSSRSNSRNLSFFRVFEK